VNRKQLLRIPILGRYLERRWMPDPVDRDGHREIVRDRLEAPVSDAAPEHDLVANEDMPPQLTGGAPEE
jgi:hypothetical protein